MTRPNQTDIEKTTLASWQKSGAFEQSNSCRKGKPFVIYDGPPFATGKPHFGHILVSVIKDVVARYQNMNGRPVPRQFGWDCHGLPIESIAQKELGMSASEVIRNDMVGVFNTKCRSLVNKCEADWEDTINRIGRWVDFKSPYRTMDLNYMESVWWAFKQIYQKDRIYKAHRIMAYSGKLMTPLSNFEVSDNYREIEDYCVVASFPVKAFDLEFSVLAYTTTPWTLPSNAALCVHPEHNYCIVEDIASKEKFLLDPARITAHFKDGVRILKSLKGIDLVGLKYEPIFDMREKAKEGQDKFYTIVADTYVSSEDGTGVVHIAPCFGEDDYRIGKANNLPMLDFLDGECKFDSNVGCLFEYKGQFCKDADGRIVINLGKIGRLYESGKIKHNYPFCDRTDSPIIYRAIDAWYLKLEDLKDKLVANNAKINWVPEHVGSGRFANWLKDCKDWNISRNRLWGSCIPLWVAKDGDTICVGSINELEKLSGHRITDLHKDFLDTITIVKGGKEYKRVPEVLDCWFESGAMPFAQFHFPFENKEVFNRNFPADFVVEGLDQTRGWFYTLLVLSTVLFELPPFKNVIVNGLLLAEDGAKMSKSKNNYADPTTILDKYGADALRMYLCSTQATHAEPVAFKEQDLETINKQIILPFLNALDFFTLYAKHDNWSEKDRVFACERKLDGWIMAKFDLLVRDLRTCLNRFEIWKAAPKIAEFMDDLCNWYIRLSRKVFWGSNSNEKSSAYYSLFNVLLGLSKALAPFIPFTADYVFNALNQEGSVHCKNYPMVATYSLRLIEEMDEVRKVANIARRIRAKSQLKTRQPLANMTVFGSKIGVEDLPLLKAEINVQSVSLKSFSEIKVQLECKPDYRKVGAVFGKDSQRIFAIIKDKLNNVQLARLHSGKSVISDNVEITSDYVIITEKIDVNGAFLSDDKITVVLDTHLTPDLIELGFVSEFRSIVQNIRKEAGLEMADRIYTEVFAGADATRVLEKHRTDLLQQLLSSDMKFFLPLNVPMKEVHKIKIDNEYMFLRLYKES